VALRALSLVHMGRPQRAVDLLESVVVGSPDAMVVHQVASIGFGTTAAPLESGMACRNEAVTFSVYR
jgi:hypothetical protein